jgi:hypothetical protein
MDASLIAIGMHGLERVLVVMFAGMSIYWGFRLFLVLPLETRSDGQLKMPGVSVVLVKAGPGIFFVAFGVLVNLASLYQPVKFTGPGVEYAGIASGQGTRLAASAKPLKAPPAASADPQAVSRVQLSLQSINCMQRLARANATGLGTDWDQASREAKLSLLAGVWDAKIWGDYVAFEKWAMGGSAAPSSAAQAFFEAERGDCPR